MKGEKYQTLQVIIHEKNLRNETKLIAIEP